MESVNKSSEETIYSVPPSPIPVNIQPPDGEFQRLCAQLYIIITSCLMAFETGCIFYDCIN